MMVKARKGREDRLRNLMRREGSLSATEAIELSQARYIAVARPIARRSDLDWQLLGREPGSRLRAPKGAPTPVGERALSTPRRLQLRREGGKEVLIALERCDVENLDRLKLAYGMNATQIVRRLLSAAVAALLK